LSGKSLKDKETLAWEICKLVREKGPIGVEDVYELLNKVVPIKDINWALDHLRVTKFIKQRGDGKYEPRLITRIPKEKVIRENFRKLYFKCKTIKKLYGQRINPGSSRDRNLYFTRHYKDGPIDWESELFPAVKKLLVEVTPYVKETIDEDYPSNLDRYVTLLPGSMKVSHSKMNLDEIIKEWDTVVAPISEESSETRGGGTQFSEVILPGLIFEFILIAPCKNIESEWYYKALSLGGQLIGIRGKRKEGYGRFIVEEFEDLGELKYKDIENLKRKEMEENKTE